MRVLNTAQMREADRRTIADLGVPSLVLMEHAARQVVSAIESRWPSLPGGGRIVVLCGKGNNGGDGLAATRLLAARGTAVRACLAAPTAEMRGDAGVNLAALRRAGVPGGRRIESFRVGGDAGGSRRMRLGDRRPVRHRTDAAPRRALAVHRQRPERLRRSGGVDRPAVGAVGRYARDDRRGGRRRPHRDPSARRSCRCCSAPRRPGPATWWSPTSAFPQPSWTPSPGRGRPSSPGPGSGSRSRAGAGTPTRATTGGCSSPPDRRARPAPPASPPSAPCAPGRAWSRWRRRASASPRWPPSRPST